MSSGKRRAAPVNIWHGMIRQVQGWMADWEAQAARAHEAVGALAGSSGDYRMAEDNAFRDVRALLSLKP